MRRLLIRPGGIGDVIVSLPALEFLKADYTEVWVPAALTPLIQFADKVLAISASGLDMAGIPGRELPRGFAERLQSFDEVVSWYGSNRETLSQLHERCTFLTALPPGDCEVNAVDFYARQVGAPLGLKPRIDAAATVPRETIVLHPFSGSAKKNWPLSSFEELARRLPVPVEWAHDRYENLLDLAQWMAGAKLYIGNDSGISHLAAAIGMRTVAIFTESNPLVWAPAGARVLQNPRIEDLVAEANRLLCSR